jgi:hypothetical protein
MVDSSSVNCRKCKNCISQDDGWKGARTKHICIQCEKVFTVTHWSDEKGAPATCAYYGDLKEWFGPFCSSRCRTLHLVSIRDILLSAKGN